MKKRSRGKSPQRPRVILFNKPFNCLCQFTDRQGRTTLADYVPVKGVYAAGRLDYDSEGLLVLTNSGELQHSIAGPEHKLEKTYLVQVEGLADAEAIAKLKKGVVLNDGITRPAKAEFLGENIEIWERVPPIRLRKNIPVSWLKITLTEGKNRQVRRMTAAVGYPTLRLVRIRVGQWELGNLTPGEWKEDLPGGSQ